MKIVFKGIDFVKMYGDDISYDKMVSFVKENFPTLQNFNLTFQDEDGDSVTIGNQTDVEVMKEMNEGKEIVRIDVVKSDEPEQPEQSEKQNSMEPERNEKESLPVEEDNKDEKCKRRKCHNKSSSKEKKCPFKKGSPENKWKPFPMHNPFFNAEVGKIVEEKINTMIPCIVNQVQANLNGEGPKIASS